MDCRCDELRDKLRQRVEFCRECGEDAIKELDEVKDSKDHYKRLAEAAAKYIDALENGTNLSRSIRSQAWQKIKGER